MIGIFMEMRSMRCEFADNALADKLAHLKAAVENATEGARIDWPLIMGVRQRGESRLKWEGIVGNRRKENKEGKGDVKKVSGDSDGLGMERISRGSGMDQVSCTYFILSPQGELQQLLVRSESRIDSSMDRLVQGVSSHCQRGNDTQEVIRWLPHSCGPGDPYGVWQLGMWQINCSTYSTNSGLALEHLGNWGSTTVIGKCGMA
ncbi:UNVERIFIED_CONTAM: hypothetical protein FKN15_077235 [Acipenser sinensis]